MNWYPLGPDPEVTEGPVPVPGPVLVPSSVRRMQPRKWAAVRQNQNWIGRATK
jgi:hypothetical protein